MVYTIIIPVLPFRLQDLHYTGISGLTGWLLFAYVSQLFDLIHDTSQQSSAVWCPSRLYVILLFLRCPR